jgi:hypothetical protein
LLIELITFSRDGEYGVLLLLGLRKSKAPPSP